MIDKYKNWGQKVEPEPGPTDLDRLTSHVTDKVHADLAAKEAKKRRRTNEVRGLAAAAVLVFMFVGHANGWW
jgi:hypothetical protein